MERMVTTELLTYELRLCFEEEPENENYDLAVQFVVWVDAQLQKGTYHFRDRDGRLLTTLDQVIKAVLAERWPVPDEK